MRIKAVQLLVAVCLLTVTSGCGNSGSVSPSQSTPSPSGNPPSPNPSPSPTAIVGKIVDGGTGNPIAGNVAVALEAMGGDFTLVMRTTADAQGSFTFNNVAAGKSYAIVAEAMSSAGVLYVPSILVSGNGVFGSGSPINPGTNVGTIPLFAPTASPSTETFAGTVTSASASGAATPVNLTFDFTTFVADFIFIVPNPMTTPVTTGTPCSSDPKVACVDFRVSSSAVTPYFGVFNPPNTTLKPFTEPPAYGLQVSASSASTGQPDCTPPVMTTGTANATPGTVQTVGPFAFSGCE